MVYSYTRVPKRWSGGHSQRWKKPHGYFKIGRTLKNCGAVETPFVSMIKSPRRVGFPQGNTPRKPFDTAIPAGFLSPTCSG